MSSINEKLREKEALTKRIEEKLTRLEQAMAKHLENHKKGIAHSSVHPRPNESFEEYSERIDEMLKERKKFE